MKSSEIMRMAECGFIEKGRIVRDQDGNDFIFTGKTFQLYNTEAFNVDKYFGLAINDDWEITEFVYTERED